MEPYWTTSLVTAPTQEPIELAEAKRQLRVEESVTVEDDLIGALIRLARRAAERHTGRAILTQTWRLKLDAFPCGGPLIIPFPPLQTLSSISYVDTNGDTQTWSSALYQTAIPSGPHASYARVTPAYQQIWPIARSQMEAVTVQFVAGWTSPELVPEEILQGMKVALSYWWAKRGDGSQPSEEDVPAIARLLWEGAAVGRWPRVA